MPITFDNSASGGFITNNFSYTLGTGNSLLVVGVWDGSGGSPDTTGVDWNSSEALTKIAEVLIPGDRWMTLWYLLNGTPGTQLVTLNGGSLGVWNTDVLSLLGVDSLLDSATTTTTSDNTTLTALASSAANWAISFYKDVSAGSYDYFGLTLRTADGFGGQILDSNGAVSAGQAVILLSGSTNAAMISALFSPFGAVTAPIVRLLASLGVGR